MASDKDFLEFVLDQLDSLAALSHRKMFGEYALYLDDKVVALVCDNQVFLKPTERGRQLLGEPAEAPPYPGAKPWFLLDDVLEEREELCRLVVETARALPPPKPKKPRKKKPA